MNIESWEPPLDKKTEHWAHVFNGIYISDILGAQNTTWVQNSGFTGIIDLSNSPHLMKFDKHVSVLRVAVDDTPTSDIKRHFSKCVQFIESQLSDTKNASKKTRKNKILVFCRGGISRSSTVIISYLMKAFCMTVEEALSFLKKRRALVQPNNGFLQQLKEYEIELRAQSQNDPINNV
jgi:protein-tyrosine phosphatase